MSQNCIQCVKNKRTGGDLLCVDCRAKQPHRCQFGEYGSDQCTREAVWVNTNHKETGYADPRYRCNAHTQGGNRISDGKPIAEVIACAGTGQPVAQELAYLPGKSENQKELEQLRVLLMEHLDEMDISELTEPIDRSLAVRTMQTLGLTDTDEIYGRGLWLDRPRKDKQGRLVQDLHHPELGILQTLMFVGGTGDGNGGWTQQVPTQEGCYWWLQDGNRHPVHVDVVTTLDPPETLVASICGYQLRKTIPSNKTGFVAVKEMGGWWKPLPVPEPPKV